MFNTFASLWTRSFFCIWKLLRFTCSLHAYQSVLKVFYMRFHAELVKLHSLIHYYNFIFIRCHYHGSKYLPHSLPVCLFGCVSFIHSVRFSSFVRCGMCATKLWWSFCSNGISVAKTNSRQIIMQLFFGITNYLFMRLWPRMAAIHKQLGRTKATNSPYFVRVY